MEHAHTAHHRANNPAVQPTHRAAFGADVDLAAAAVFSALVLFASAAFAQPSKYPDRPVRFVVPFAPGGGTDILARVLAPRLTEALGQPVVVENRAGAGSNIGAEAVARAAPDGYTLLLGSNTQAINATLYPKIAFDVLRDFAPITLLASAPMVLVTHPSVPAKSMAEFIAYAKREPGRLNFSSPGTGTPHHIAAELFIRMANVNVVQIPYKGAGPALADTLAGQTHFTVQTLAAVRTHIAAGKLAALGVASSRRAQVAPSIPTIAEGGVPGYEAELWFAVLAPAGTPPAIVARLNTEFNRVLGVDEVRERLSAQGFELRPSTAAELGRILSTDVEKYARVIRDANITLE